MFLKNKKFLLKLIFPVFFVVFGLLGLFSPTTEILAASGGCICNNSTACPNSTQTFGSMFAASTACTNHCTTGCAGGGVSSFIPYWPCRCCDGTDLGERSDSGCRADCASHDGAAISGDPSSYAPSDCPGRFTPPSGGTGTTPLPDSPGCYCSGTLARAMACTAFTDCQTVCPAGTAATDIMCVPGYSTPSTSTDGTSGGPSPENNSLCWRQSQCINNCPVAGGCTWEDPSKYPPCASSTGDFGRCIPTHAEPVTLQIPIIGVQQIANIADYIALIYKYIVSVGGILAGIMIMIGGLLYLTAGGSPERVGNAKSYIGNALIGLVLLLTSYVVLQTINPQLVQFSRFTIPLIRPARLPATLCNEFSTPLPNQPPLKFASAAVAGTPEIKPFSEIRDVDYTITDFSEMRCGATYYEQASGDQTCLGGSCKYTSDPKGACFPFSADEKQWSCIGGVAIWGKYTCSSPHVDDIELVGIEPDLDWDAEDEENEARTVFNSYYVVYKEDITDHFEWDYLGWAPEFEFDEAYIAGLVESGVLGLSGEDPTCPIGPLECQPPLLTAPGGDASFAANDRMRWDVSTWDMRLLDHSSPWAAIRCDFDCNDVCNVGYGD